MVKAMELQERRSELLFRHLQTTSSLCMGISDEIKFVTIAIYETTTLEIKATIALLFRSSFFFFPPDQVVVCCSSKLTSWACSVTTQINSSYIINLLKTNDLMENMQRKPLERLNVNVSF